MTANPQIIEENEVQLDLNETDESVLIMTNNLDDAEVGHSVESQKQVLDSNLLDSKTNHDEETSDTANDKVSIGVNLQRPVITNPFIDLRQRVLALSQKGDWEALEIALRILEKEAAEEQNATPLANVTDEASNHFTKKILYRMLEYQTRNVHS